MEAKLAKNIEINYSLFPLRKKHYVRENKKLLVLDIDSTLCDFGHSDAMSNDPAIKRPYLNEFLKRAYVHYDIGLYSSAPLSSVRIKVRFLQIDPIDTNPNYKIMFYLHQNHLVPVQMPGRERQFLKALPIIWHHFECYNEKNTILVDDNEMNFYLNPANGLQIIPYTRALYQTDTELSKLADYLESIASCEDITKIDLKIS